MKASDWAQKFISGEKNVFELMEDFAKEAVDLIATRTKHSDGQKFVEAAVEGAVREARSKWAAVQARCPKLKPFGFEQIAKQIKAAATMDTFRYVA